MNLQDAAIQDNVFCHLLWLKVFCLDANMLRCPGKSRGGVDIDVEEKPENYWQIWETSVFCLRRVNKQKNQTPKCFMKAQQAKKTPTNPQTKKPKIQ